MIESIEEEFEVFEDLRVLDVVEEPVSSVSVYSDSRLSTRDLDLFVLLFPASLGVSAFRLVPSPPSEPCLYGRLGAIRPLPRCHPRLMTQARSACQTTRERYRSFSFEEVDFEAVGFEAVGFEEVGFDPDLGADFDKAGTDEVVGSVVFGLEAFRF